MRASIVLTEKEAMGSEAGEMSPTRELLPDNFLAPVKWNLAHVQYGANEASICNIMLKNTKMDKSWGKLQATLS